ncbi:uncharacterized protein LOC111692412 [Anoplophora glabripennis]|uniref:uncharacterized protein LOC111692412 n=1 Tax=Anoplophora glabripennis TaxID=217634 RepID=UPI000C79474F|nr:uncharacterized protein LOC111692412 [Anoplophora glabripennis]
MNHFKRIVIRGKRGRGVPVLFSKDVQNHIKILMSLRADITQKPNLYLFGNPSTKNPIYGYKILRKYAVACGAKNPDALTCTRLRKHLATLTQLFHLTENDMEQLSSFMGHTLGVHRSSYRLPDDVYQTAKISKLLLLMEKGEAGQFKGKTLDDININIDEDLLDMEHNNNDTELLEAKDNNEDLDDLLAETIQAAKNSNLPDLNKESTIEKKTKFKKRILIPWTEAQKKIVLHYFKENIKAHKPPKRSECEDLKKKHQDLLKNKDWQKIKVFIQNQYTKK